MPLEMWMGRPTPVAFVPLFLYPICTLLSTYPNIYPTCFTFSPNYPYFSTQFPAILLRLFRWTSQVPSL